MIQALLPAIGPIVDKLVGLIPDPNARDRAKVEAEAAILAAVMKTQSDQVEINKIEAANPNLFVSGWRPGLGWVLVLAFGYQYLARPILIASGVDNVPALDGSLMELTIAMLGLGGLRTLEKMRGVAAR